VASSLRTSRGLNLFAYRATDPKALRLAGVDVVGGGNDEALRWASSIAGRTLAAWGAGGRLRRRGQAVTPLLEDPLCLGVTRRGEPRHPLYVPQSVTPIPYRRP
jgi:hypothetical protein